MTTTTTEPPILVDYLVRSNHYHNESRFNTVVERRPNDSRELWLDYSKLKTIVPPARTAFPGTPDGGVPPTVSGISGVLMTQVVGKPKEFESTLTQFLDMVPTTVTLSDMTKWKPTLKDSTGAIVPYDPGVWSADGILGIIRFHYGVPTSIIPPFTIDYWRYIGAFVTGIGGTVTLTSAGGTETLVSGGVGPALQTKGLTAGDGISLSSDAVSITITNSSPATSVTLTSAGGTETLVVDGSGPSLSNKGLTAGDAITLTGGVNDVTITNSSPATSVTLASAGGTETLVVDGSGPSLSNKGLTAGFNITLTGGVNDVTISTSGASQQYVVQDLQTTGVNGGASVALVWTSRTLNTLTGSGSDVTLAANQVTLVTAGTYYIEASMPLYRSNPFKSRFIRVSGGTSTPSSLIGTSEAGFIGANATQTRSFVKGIITVTANTVFAFQYYCLTARATDGLGLATGAPGISEVYSQITVRRIS